MYPSKSKKVKARQHKFVLLHDDEHDFMIDSSLAELTESKGRRIARICSWQDCVNRAMKGMVYCRTKSKKRGQNDEERKSREEGKTKTGKEHCAETRRVNFSYQYRHSLFKILLFHLKV